MRFVAGGLLLIMSMIVLGTLKPDGPLAEVMRGYAVAQGFGFFSFAAGVFCMLPRFWEWRRADPGAPVSGLVRFFQGTWTAFGALMMIVGLVFLGGAAWMIKGQEVALAIFGALVGLNYMAASALTVQPVWAQMGARPAPKKNLDTNKVLRMARAHKGRITPTEIAAQSTFTVHEAAAILKQLAADGFCEERVSELGSSFFLFPEFASPAAKRDLFEEDEVIFGEAREEVVLDAEVESRARRSH